VHNSYKYVELSTVATEHEAEAFTADPNEDIEDMHALEA
jgi:hypothetical protein